MSTWERHVARLAKAYGWKLSAVRHRGENAAGPWRSLWVETPGSVLGFFSSEPGIFEMWPMGGRAFVPTPAAAVAEFNGRRGVPDAPRQLSLW